MTSINNLSSTDTIYPGDLFPIWRTANSDTRKVSLFTLTSYLQTNLGSGLLITPTGGTASATADDLFGDLTPLRGFGEIVGDGATSNNTAVTFAEASSFKQINVPEGIYRATDIAFGYNLTKTYNGPGQIKTNDGNALIPSWRVISSTPVEGNHNYILTAGNGDAQQVQGFVGTWITGAATLTQPPTGYKVIYETAGRLSHFFVAADAGWNESTTGNDGRTGYFNNVTIGTQAGNGDAGGYFTSIFVTGVRSAGGGGPGVPTDALAMPAGAVHAGQVQAGVNDVYLNNIEMNATDNGYRASAGVFVANLSRDNSDTTNNQFWFAFAASSIGTQDADVAFRVGGRWKLGLDLTAATLNGNQAGIVLKQDQRIFFTGTAGSRYCTAPGSAYMLGSSVGIDMHYNSAVALRVTAQVNPVTYLQVQGTATGVPLSLTTQSTDTNAGVDLQPKGTGSARLLSGGGTAQVQANNTGLGFFATAPIAKPTVTGSRAGNAALASLLTQLASLGLITDSSS